MMLCCACMSKPSSVGGEAAEIEDEDEEEQGEGDVEGHCELWEGI